MEVWILRVGDEWRSEVYVYYSGITLKVILSF